MIEVSDSEFEAIISEAMDSLPAQLERVSNVAIVFEDEPTAAQRQELHLQDGQTLYGLYEGVPLPQRNGAAKLLPDKITLFKKPLEYGSASLDDLRRAVRYTLWHELAHYYGLDHPRIHELEQ